MIQRNLLLATSLLSLGACSAASGEHYQPKPVAKDQARVIVYKTQTYGMGVAFTANERQCKVQRQGYIDFDVPAGRAFTLRHRSLGDPSPSVMLLEPNGGETVYVRVESNDEAIGAAAIGSSLAGLVGGMAAHGVVSDGGTFHFVPGNAGEASTTSRSNGGC